MTGLATYLLNRDLKSTRTEQRFVGGSSSLIKKVESFYSDWGKLGKEEDCLRMLK